MSQPHKDNPATNALMEKILMGNKGADQNGEDAIVSFFIISANARTRTQMRTILSLTFGVLLVLL